MYIVQCTLQVYWCNETPFWIAGFVFYDKLNSFMISNNYMQIECWSICTNGTKPGTFASLAELEFIRLWHSPKWVIGKARCFQDLQKSSLLTRNHMLTINNPDKQCPPYQPKPTVLFESVQIFCSLENFVVFCYSDCKLPKLHGSQLVSWHVQRLA